MSRKFQIGDRVNAAGIDRDMIVTEVSPHGYEPAHGSSYTVRCGPPGGTKPEEWVFGDTMLTLTERKT